MRLAGSPLTFAACTWYIITVRILVFRAAVVLAPSSKAGVIVLTNGESKPFIEMTTQSLLEQLLQ
jgi:hypothetical protein